MKVRIPSKKELDSLNYFDSFVLGSEPTDFAVVTGLKTDEPSSWLSDSIYDDKVWCLLDKKMVFEHIDKVDTNYIEKRLSNRYVGIRPVIKYSSVKDEVTDETYIDDEISAVNFGEYPRISLPKELEDKLENLYSNGELLKTEKTYTTDGEDYNPRNLKKFVPTMSEEYVYEDEKYVRIKANSFKEKFSLSNGHEYKSGDYVWLKVAPVEWYVCKANDMMISKEMLLSGIYFSDKKEYNGIFRNTWLNKYLNTYFAKDIVPSKKVLEKQEKKEVKKEEKKKNLSARQVEISRLVNKIEDGYSLLGEESRNVVKASVDNLLKKYNDGLVSLNEDSNSLNLTLDTPETLYVKLYTELSIMCDDLSSYYKSFALLNGYRNAFNNGDANSSLESDLKSINEGIMPFLKAKDSEKIRDRVNGLINKYEDELNKSLSEKKKAPFASEKLIISFRKDLHEILLDISDKVNSNSFVKEVNDSLHNNLVNVKEESKSNIVKFYFKNINDVVISIRSKTNEASILTKLDEILNFDIDYSLDVCEIMDKLNKVIRQLYEIENDVNMKDKGKDDLKSKTIRR